jgi:hypothetical protein
MKNILAIRYLQEQKVISENEKDLVISFDDDRKDRNLSELLRGYSDYAEKTLENNYIDPSLIKRFEMDDGTRITIGANSMDFFMKLQDLPMQKLVRLFDFDEMKLEQYLESNREKNNEELKNLFNQRWICRVYDERYRFSDADLNELLFGLRLTKTQIFGRLKSNTLQRSKVLELIEWFKNQEDYKLID